MDATIVTCVTEPQLYSDLVLKSAYECSAGHNLHFMPIDCRGRSIGIGGALNLALGVSKTNLVIFCHQDIVFMEDWFTKLERITHEIDEWGVIGCAGMSMDYSVDHVYKWGGSAIGTTLAVGRVYSSPDSTEPYWQGERGVRFVHCIDECVFVLNRNTGIRFDKRFDGVHFYGVDVSLQSRAAGFPVVVGDLPVAHVGTHSRSMSTGDYWKYFRQLHTKWHLNFPELLGTHMHWRDRELTSYIPRRISGSSGLSLTINAASIRL